LRPGRRCLVRTESSTAVRGVARAPLAARPWVAGGINAPNAPYRPRLSLAFNECMQENWKFRAGAIIRVRSKVAILRNKTNTETKLVGHYSPSPKAGLLLTTTRCCHGCCWVRHTGRRCCLAPMAVSPNCGAPNRSTESKNAQQPGYCPPQQARRNYACIGATGSCHRDARCPAARGCGRTYAVATTSAPSSSEPSSAAPTALDLTAAYVTVVP
jgi:hypothetical protein